jgi:Domain of unknown function (DUF4232)
VWLDGAVTRGGVIAGLSLTALLAACSSPSPATSPSPSAPISAAPSPSPTSTSPPTTTPTAAPTSSGPQECTASQLQGAMDSTQGAAGTIYTGWEVRDTAAVACTLDGYFGVQISSQGSNLSLSYTPYSGNGVSPAPVLLQPGTAPIDSGNDVGHAIFYMRWSDVCNSPEAPNAFEFTPPHLTGSFTVSVTSTSVNLCGHVDIGPISPRGAANPFA